MREGTTGSDGLIRGRTVQISSARFGFLALPRSPPPQPSSSAAQKRTRVRTRRRRSTFVILAIFHTANTSRRRFAIGTSRASALAPRAIRRHVLPPRESIQCSVESATNRRSNSWEVVSGSSSLRSLHHIFFRHDERIGASWIGIGEPSFRRFEIS